MIFSIVNSGSSANNPGTLDPNFGNNGTVIFNNSNVHHIIRGLVIDSNNKILLGGYTSDSLGSDTVLLKFSYDGNIDGTFGNNGVTFFDNSGTTDRAFAITIDSSDYIYLAGHTTSNNSDALLLKYKPDGTIDNTFGTNGVVTYLPSASLANAIAINNNDIFVAGNISTNATDVLLLKYDKNSGSPVNSFGSSGVVTYNGGTNVQDTGRAVAVNQAGEIFVAGTTNPVGIPENVLLLKYQPNGSLDNSFGNNGVVTYDHNPSNNDLIYSIALGNNVIYLAGETISGSNRDILLLKYQQNGTPDTSFGNNGIVTYDSGGSEAAYAIAIDDDNEIYLAGINFGANANIIVLKYKPNGNLDTSFGNNGVVIYDQNSMERAFGIAIKNDHLYVGGDILVNGRWHAFLLRFNK
ncbi:MAG: delta-60 repeat domain-containing protein [bacterium]